MALHPSPMAPKRGDLTSAQTPCPRHPAHKEDSGLPSASSPPSSSTSEEDLSPQCLVTQPHSVQLHLEHFHTPP